MARMCGTANRVKEKPIEFKLHAPGAKRVSVAGSFNNWNANTLSAKKDLSGNWKTRINLWPGKYEYKFFVDGAWVDDPNCKSRIGNAFGTQNCVIEIK